MNTSVIPLSAAKSLRETVGEQLKAISPAVSERVVETFVEAETAKCADAIVKGLHKLTEFEREGYKLAKGDVVTYDADGNVASATFTKERLEEAKKNREKTEKLTRALDKAISKLDMGDLYGLIK